MHFYFSLGIFFESYGTKYNETLYSEHLVASHKSCPCLFILKVMLETYLSRYPLKHEFTIYMDESSWLADKLSSQGISRVHLA